MEEERQLTVKEKRSKTATGKALIILIIVIMAVAPSLAAMTSTAKQTKQTNTLSNQSNPIREGSPPTGISWAKAYGGAHSDEAWSVQQTTDGGYIVAGATWSFGAGTADVWVLKLDSTGGVTWQKTFGGTSWDVALSARQTTDGGYMVVADTNSSGAGDFDFWFLKLDSTGGVTWQKMYGGTGDDQAQSFQQTSDGGYIVAGYTTSFGAGSSDFWVLKLGVGGEITWDAGSGASTHPTDVTPSDSSATITATSVAAVNSTATVTVTTVIPSNTTATVMVQATPDTTPPSTITDLAVIDTGTIWITLNWTPPGDDGNTGTATGYVVKYSTSGPIVAAGWSSAANYTQSWTPLGAGSAETRVITGLNSSTTYWFAVMAYDEVPNYGGISNSPTATTTTTARGGGQGIPLIIIVGVVGVVAVIVVILAAVLFMRKRAMAGAK